MTFFLQRAWKYEIELRVVVAWCEKSIQKRGSHIGMAMIVAEQLSG